MGMSSLTISPFTDFRSTSTAVLEYLQDQLGFALWMVTRVAGDDWIVLTSKDQGYGVEDGAVFRWTDSFCSRMVQGDGPRIAPESCAVPAYAAAPIGRAVPIGAYIGLPLSRNDGTLFGTLCAIDPDAKSECILNELPHLEMIARMLSTVLEAELQRDLERQRAERAEAEAMTDSLTGLFNRRGWDRLMEAEESRCKRYGHEAAVLSIDLDLLKQTNDTWGHEAGDRLLRRLARVLSEETRAADVAARVGGDEFGVITHSKTVTEVAEFAARLERRCSAAGVGASIGFARREPPRTLFDAWNAADQQMYSRKKERKAIEA